MIWYVFDMTGFPEPLHLSLTRAFMRQSRRAGLAGPSHLFARPTDSEAVPRTYYLCTGEGNAFTRMIRQFGGRKCSPPSQQGLREIKTEIDPKAPLPEVDTAPC